jgi:heme/copper-type cytochrome/quinol oxidase subunit 3
VLLVGSSVTLRWGELGIRRADVRRLTLGLIATIALGAGFLGVQIFEYALLEHMPQTDAYWSTFYTIISFHGAHVLLGLMMLAMNLVRARQGHFTADRHLAVQNGALYWHMVDLVWIGIVAALYLSPRL